MPALDDTITPGQLGHISDHEAIAAQLNAANATYVQVANRPVSLRDVAGIDWTGATSSQTVVQAAITAAGQGAVIEFGRGGIINGGTGLTLLQDQTLIGGGLFLGSGGSPESVLKFPSITGTQVGITGATGVHIKDLQIRGPGVTATGTVGFKTTSGTPRFTNVGFVGFDTGASLTGAYYAVFTNCEFTRNKYGLANSGNYNLTLFNCRFWCSYGVSDGTLGTGILGTARGCNIFGGAIEGYQTAITMSPNEHLNLQGVYFETLTTATTCTGVGAYGVSGVSVNAEGCFVYLNGHNYWVRMDTGTNSVLTAKGNHFVCPNTTAATPTGYIVGTSATMQTDVGPDSWGEVARTGAQYISANDAIIPGRRVVWPYGHATYGIATHQAAPVLRGLKSQTLASNGAVTFDNTYSRHEITLQANATSSAFAAAIATQEVLITFIQDATGGRTYAWPTVCRFAGGSTPSDTTANTRTSVMFRYDGSSGKWKELYRAVAVP